MSTTGSYSKVVGLTLGLLASLVMAPSFRPVAANAHVAPLAALVATSVEEEPRAVLGGTDPDPVEILRSQQMSRRANDRVQHLLEGAVFFRFFELVAGLRQDNRSAGERRGNIGIEDSKGVCGRRVFLFLSIWRHPVDPSLDLLSFPDGSSLVRRFFLPLTLQGGGCSSAPFLSPKPPGWRPDPHGGSGFAET